MEKDVKELYIEAYRLFDGSKSGTALGRIRLEELDRLYGTEKQKAAYALDDLIKEVFVSGLKNSGNQDIDSLDSSIKRGYNPVPSHLWTKYQRIKMELGNK